MILSHCIIYQQYNLSDAFSSFIKLKPVAKANSLHADFKIAISQWVWISQNTSLSLSLFLCCTVLTTVQLT